MIIWAGTSSKDVGMVVEHYPSVMIPEKIVEVQEVPGRNGNIVIPTGSFQNYTQKYQVFLDSKYLGGLEAAMPKVVDWLLGHDGYQKLEDSYFPDFYRMAYYTGGSEFVSFFNEYGEGTLTFNCAPEKYYKYGLNPIDIPSTGKTIYNPTSFDALPIIEVYMGVGSATGQISVNARHVTVSNDPDVVIAPEATDIPMILDVKNHQYYMKELQHLYNAGVVGDYNNLKLTKASTITWSGNIHAVKVIPNWWTI
jgi:phage-related protein